MLSFFLATALVASAALAQPNIPIRDFIDRDDIENPVLSPDGRHVAVTMDSRSTVLTYRTLRILSLPDLRTVTAIKLGQISRPGDYVWVSNRRLVVSQAYRHTEGVTADTGELVGVDIDGTRQQYLYGRLRVRAKGEPADSCWPSRFQASRALDDSLLITTSGASCGKLYRIDTVTGARTVLADRKESNIVYLLDRNDKPQLAYTVDTGSKLMLQRWNEASSRWESAPGDGTIGTIRPIGITADGQGYHALETLREGGDALVVRSLDGTPPRTLLQLDAGDVDMAMLSGTGSVIAAGTRLGRPAWHYLDANSDAARVHRELAAQFPGQLVQFLSGRHGERWLFEVVSDRDPGSVYVYEEITRRATLLVTRQARLDPDLLGERRPIRVTARDGVTLHGYLTLPRQMPANGLPALIVHPHGGPHGIADQWFYDRDAQFLASRGYAVLQLNFRGSGGRGPAFVESGYGKWASAIQDDLLDAVDWVTGQGLADGSRMCTYGGSFGAYSAMMLAIRAPGRFRCAVGVAGLYDIPLHMAAVRDAPAALTWPHDSSGALAWLRRYVGSDEREWERMSPSRQADRIGIPVLLAHGWDDPRTRLDQAKALRAALRRAGNAAEYLGFANEEHGFVEPDHQAEFYESLERFLARYLAPPHDAG